MYIGSCVICRSHNLRKTKAPVQETDIPRYAFAKVGLDIETLNVCHVTTSFYHPNSNGKIEIFHRILNDLLAKILHDNVTTGDLHLNQTLSAIRFKCSESTKFSSFFLLYNRDAVLPLDNTLKHRRKYEVENSHKIALEQQHKSFVLVHKYLKGAKRRQAKYANKKAGEVQLEIGDPVYCQVHNKPSKLHNN